MFSIILSFFPSVIVKVTWREEGREGGKSEGREEREEREGMLSGRKQREKSKYP